MSEQNQISHNSNTKSLLALTVVILVSCIQYNLHLNLKWPYTSDSLFYTHNLYQLQGNTYEQSRQKVLSNHPIPWKDTIQQNIFRSKETYKKVYRVFTKRPLYPLVAYGLFYIVRNEESAFILPVFFGYLGVIILNFILIKNTLGNFLATISSFLLISFQPFLYWSTFIMTDTIGAFFWLFQIYFVLLYFTKKKAIYLKLFAGSLIISLFNREQSVLLIPLFVTIVIMIKTNLLSKSISTYNSKLLLTTLIISTIFMLGIKSLGQLTAWDNLKYIQSNYYITSSDFTFTETFLFYIPTAIRANINALYAVANNPFYLLIFTLGFITACKAILDARKTKKPLAHIDALFIASAISSYLSIFIVPVFEFRFFFPVAISAIYFFLKFTANFFYLELKPDSPHIKSPKN